MNTQYRKNLKAVMQKSKEYTDNIYTLATNNTSGTDTSTNILAFTTNKGIYIGSDTGHWYYWNGTQYVDGGVYQATQLSDTDKFKIDSSCASSTKSFYTEEYNLKEYQLKPIWQVGALRRITNAGEFITTSRFAICTTDYLDTLETLYIKNSNETKYRAIVFYYEKINGEYVYLNYEEYANKYINIRKRLRIDDVYHYNLYVRIAFYNLENGYQSASDSILNDLLLHLPEIYSSTAMKSDDNYKYNNCELIGKYAFDTTDDGDLIEANVWRCFALNVKAGEKYRIFNDITSTATSTSRPLYAFYSFNVETFNEYKQVGNANFYDYLHYWCIETSGLKTIVPDGRNIMEVTVPEGANCMFVTTGLEAEDNYKIFNIVNLSKVKTYDVESENVNLESISSLGTINNGILDVIGDNNSHQFSFPRLSNSYENHIFEVDAYYEQNETNEVPTIQFIYSELFRGTAYTIGSTKEFTNKKFRFPAYFDNERPYFRIEFVVPTGVTLHIRKISHYYSNEITPYNGGARLNAHLGFWGLCPENTIIGYKKAHDVGYPACIVNPRTTSDGVFVCVHDVTINRTGRNDDGSAIVGEVIINETTYADLLQYDVGQYKTESYTTTLNPFKGTRVPKLEDFFKLCAKTGMLPMFSTHQAFTTSQWQEIKEMASKYGILKNLHIKSFDINIIRTAYSVMGTDIDGFTLDVSGSDYQNAISGMNSIGFDTSLRLGIEYQNGYINSTIANATKNAGYFCAVWNLQRITSERYIELMDMGVTEFTDDYNCSVGLDW